MTFDHDAHTDDEIQYFCGPSGSLDSTFDPSDSLVDWLVGNPPIQSYRANDPNHRIGQLQPIGANTIFTDVTPIGWSRAIAEYWK